MAAFTSLPTDIIQIIIHFIFECAGPDIIATKVKIPLLSICRKWRAIAIPMFYNQAYFRSYKRQDYSLQPSRTYLVVHTNIDIILQNGNGDCVKNFVYISQEEAHSFDSLMNMAQMLDISADSCPELASLMNFHGDNSNISADRNYKQHTAEITSIANTLASKFPNIKHLDIKIDNAHGFIICFLSALADCFADKLVEFNYNGPLGFLNKKPMSCLEAVNLHFIENNEDLMYPVICPQTIQTMTLVSDKPSFSWKSFSTNNALNNIVFDNLEYLNCRVLDCTDNYGNSNIDFRIQLPNIKKISALNCSLSTDDIERQLRSGLRELYYINKLPKLMELSQLDLSGLVYLKLLLYKPDDSDAEDEFVALTNRLFSRLKGISTVEVNFHVGMDLIDPAVIYWPNLTRLVFDMTVMSGNIFDTVLYMPDLIYLEIKHFYFDDDELECLLTYFKDLRTKHTNPSGSNITTLKIRNMKQIYYDQFMSSVQVLRWYWPKLATIDIRF